MISRAYQQALQPLGLSLPQAEILAELMGAAGPVKPATLAVRLMTERSTLSRNLALMRDKGWITAGTSPTGRTTSVVIADPGVAVLARASTAWRHTQATMETALGPATSSTLAGWLGLLTEAAG